jgi:ligand-binding SRPBCC domain-containing protein
MEMVFNHRSIVPASAAEVFRWHEQPEALLELLPSRGLVRIESRKGGMRDGGLVTLSIGIGMLRFRWTSRHFGYVAGREFSDEQVRGPFAIWRHTHRVAPLGPEQCVYEDHIEYAVRGGAVVGWLVNPCVRLVLEQVFSRRHQIVRRIFADARDSRLRARYFVGPSYQAG